MRLQFKQFKAIAMLTALEAARQPILLLLTASCLLFIGLLPVLITHVLGDASRMVRDSALALQLVCGLVLGSYAACATLTREVHRGTASSVLSKPVGRATFFLAKFAGIALVMTLYAMATSIAILLSVRTAAITFVFDWWGILPLLGALVVSFAVAGLQDYFLRRPFISRAWGLIMITLPLALMLSCLVGADGQRGAFGSAIPWNIVPACALIAMAIFVLSGMAVTLATRWDVMPTLTTCGVLFMFGLISDYVLGRAAAQHRAVAWLYSLAPNWQHFWAVDALNRDGIPWFYVGQAGLYAALYLVGVLCLGVFVMRQVEVR